MKQYKSAAHCKYLCQYHLIWCPRYRKKVLQKQVGISLKKILTDIAKEYDYEIIALEVMDEHVHIFVSVKPSVAPSDVVRILKSLSAVRLFAEYEALRVYYSKQGSLWSKGKFIATVGNISADAVKKYIEEQKTKDDSESV